MELGMNLQEYDFGIGNDEKQSSGLDAYSVNICEPEWFVGKGFDRDEDELDTIRNQADYFYFKKEFTKASERYKLILQKVPPKNSIVKREALECLARTHIKIGDFEKAQFYSDQLLKTSYPNNADHLMINLELQSLVANGLDKRLQELSLLTKIIDVHPFAPSLWLRLGRCYQKLSMEKDVESLTISRNHPMAVREFCLVRALILLQTVQKSVKSFSKEANSRLQSDISAEKRDISSLLTPDEKERIQLYASMDIYNRNLDTNPENEAQEFIDLGSSKRMAKDEKEKSDEIVPLEEESLSKIIDFESKWFSFLNE